MKPLRFHPEAEAELLAAAAWYETQQGDLGKRFLAAVRDSLVRIQMNPRLFPLVDDEIRRCLTRTFPFGLLFQVEPDKIVIWAVMHLHREPGYWKNRVPEP